MDILITKGVVRGGGGCWLGVGDHGYMHMTCNVIIEPVRFNRNQVRSDIGIHIKSSIKQ